MASRDSNPGFPQDGRLTEQHARIISSWLIDRVECLALFSINKFCAVIMDIVRNNAYLGHDGNTNGGDSIV